MKKSWTGNRIVPKDKVTPLSANYRYALIPICREGFEVSSGSNTIPPLKALFQLYCIRSNQGIRVN